MDFPTRYDPLKEPQLYQELLEKNAFEPKGEGKPFCIVTPPPNITGDLHLGHALTFAIEDTIARNKRRLGYKVLLVPGADHAGIATQIMVEKKLAKEGKSRQALGREAFLKEVWQWADYYLPRVKESIMRFGASCAWSHFRFTLDQHSQEAVKEAFVRLYEKGLIYQDYYLVNWDTKLQTAVSDDEVVYQEVPGKLYWIKYGPVSVATTRPETKLGDSAIAVHPDDERYKHLINKEIEFTNEQGRNQKLKIVADKIVDPNFGTGAVKVTPAHDHADWLLGQAHHLAVKEVIGKDGRIVEGYEPYSGLKVLEAREKIVEDLKRLGLIEKITDYTIRQPVGERTGAVIEPLVSRQWFVRTTALKDRALKAVKSGQITFLPKSLEKVYFHWLENLRDWCISRQLWWGHQLPVYYCQSKTAQTASSSASLNKSYTVAKEKPADCPICGKCAMEQSEDVLDTWFSSSLWPFSTLGWPNQTEDFKTFFPTDLMETGADIIFFWVARMIMMSLALTDQIPFKRVYFHGLILDKDGKKMSKSRGNATEPMEMIEKYGADALRMGLIGGNTPGQNQKFSEQKILKYRNFVTKIWNASRFVAMTCQSADVSANTDSSLSLHSKEEKAFFAKLESFEARHQKFLDNLQLSLALEELYDFFWNDFCAQFLETQKEAIKKAKSRENAHHAAQALTSALRQLLALISDFAPFLVESIRRDLLLEKRELN